MEVERSLDPITCVMGVGCLLPFLKKLVTVLTRGSLTHDFAESSRSPAWPKIKELPFNYGFRLPRFGTLLPGVRS
jgi:hypothetical protein